MATADPAALKGLYESIIGRMAANPDMDLVTMRSMFEELATASSEPEGVTYAEVDAAGVPAIWCNPQEAAADRVVLYTHGGGFMGNTAHSHRKLAAHLAKAAGARALVVEYRLAPEHVFPAQLDDAQTAHSWLLDQGVPASGIALAGDSAGANLAIGLALRLGLEGAPRPAAVAVFSPWVDMEHGASTLASNADKDALISLGVVTMMSQMVLGEGGSARDPLINALHADFAGYPPLHVTAGGDEALLDDSQRLAERAREAGVDVELRVVPDQQHVFVFMAGRAAVADEAIAATGRWLRPHLHTS